MRSCAPYSDGIPTFIVTIRASSHTFSGKLHIALYWKLNPGSTDLDSGSTTLRLLADPDPAKCHVGLD